MTEALLRMETLFQALGDATRLRILGLLLGGEVCVCHIHESLRISQPKTSRHLAYLRRAGLVAARRQGPWVYYRLADRRDAVTGTVRDVVAHALGHLDLVRRDRVRLQEKTGCGLPAPGAPPAFACCAGAPAGRR
ncbi:MAG: metalloregulator ArsR/SmtB family transcription factor [Acidobacteria bacterium]|nr:metalloregulator ArsR/SmtB family transcription factor [Acidobacteriota bacterium]